MKVSVSIPLVADGVREALCARLARAADAFRRADRPFSAETCEDYRAQIITGDPLTYALLRHWSRQLCDAAESIPTC